MPTGIPQVLVWSGISDNIRDVQLPPRLNVAVQTYPDRAMTFRSRYSCGLSYDRTLFYEARGLAQVAMHKLGSATWTQPADLQPSFGPREDSGCTSSYENNRKMWLTGGSVTTCTHM